MHQNNSSDTVKPWCCEKLPHVKSPLPPRASPPMAMALPAIEMAGVEGVAFKTAIKARDLVALVEWESQQRHPKTLRFWGTFYVTNMYELPYVWGLNYQILPITSDYQVITIITIYLKGHCLGILSRFFEIEPWIMGLMNTVGTWKLGPWTGHQIEAFPEISRIVCLKVSSSSCCSGL